MTILFRLCHILCSACAGGFRGLWCILAVVLPAAVLGVHVQAASADSLWVLSDRVNRFNRLFPQEKVYLHFDNTGYFMNEMLWYKAYVRSTDADTLGSRSRVLYVELLNAEGDVLIQQRLLLEHGQAAGSMLLDSATLFRPGFYEVRAYTKYMLNWGEEAVFSRVLPVFDVPKDEEHPLPERNLAAPSALAAGRTAPKGRRRTNIRFYPEGGHAVQGLPCRMAFTLTDGSGRALQGTYRLSDGSAATLEQGRGAVRYVPGGAPATLLYTDGMGHTERFILPEGESRGCALQVDVEEADRVQLHLAVSPDLYGTPLGVAWLRSGHVYRLTRCVPQQGGLQWYCPRDSLREGVNQLTVITPQGEIVASRMVFVYPHAAQQYAVVDSVQTVADTAVLHLQTAPGSVLSVSVRDAMRQTGGTDTDVACWWLLTSDLRGFIPHPERYLERDDAAHRRMTDLLMLVQGWRRYDFQTMEGKATFAVRHMPERQLTVRGEVLSSGKRQSVDDAVLLVALKNGLGDLVQGAVRVDSTGRFIFVAPDCYGTFDMLLMTGKDNRLSNYKVRLDNYFSPAPRYIFDAELPSAEAYEGQLLLENTAPTDSVDLLHGTIALNTFTYSGDLRKAPKLAWYSEHKVERRAGLRYDCRSDLQKILDSGEEAPTLVEYLRRKNPQFAGNDNLSGEPAYYRLQDCIYPDGPSYGHRPIVWMVDNQLVAITGAPMRYAAPRFKHGDEVSAQDVPLELPHTFPVSLEEVKRVYISPDRNVFRFNLPEYESLFGSAVGVFVYTLPVLRSMEKGVRYTTFEGFNRAAVFDETIMSLVRPERDIRRTLYWNPNVRTDAEGKAVVRFKMRPKSNLINLSVQGFAKDGRPVTLPPIPPKSDE